MIQEDKELLLKDLCARLPYGVVVELDEKFGFNKGVHSLVKELLDPYCVEGIKPYLRPMSSMTEEEKEQLYSAIDFYGKIDKDGDIDASDHEFVFSETCMEYIDWLNEHHFDYRGLIEKGLAIAVTVENDTYK